MAVEVQGFFLYSAKLSSSCLYVMIEVLEKNHISR